jgi:hypothetical protein
LFLKNNFAQKPPKFLLVQFLHNRIALRLLNKEHAVEREFTFQHFAIKCLSKNYDLVEGGDRNAGYVKAIGVC